MNGEAELTTVYRSADDDARESAEAIRDLLAGEGLNPELLDDSAPGVPEGAYVVQVPAPQAARAEELIGSARLPEDELIAVNDSADLNAETVFSAPAGTTAELEAMSVQSILEGAGIATIMVGDAVLPNLPFEIRVAKDQAEKARQLIEEAKASGPAAAEEAAAETAGPGPEAA